MLRKVEIEPGLRVELVSTKLVLSGWVAYILFRWWCGGGSYRDRAKFRELSPISTARCAWIVSYRRRDLWCLCPACFEICDWSQRNEGWESESLQTTERTYDGEMNVKCPWRKESTVFLLLHRWLAIIVHTYADLSFTDPFHFVLKLYRTVDHLFVYLIINV